MCARMAGVYCSILLHLSPNLNQISIPNKGLNGISCSRMRLIRNRWPIPHLDSNHIKVTSYDVLTCEGWAANKLSRIAKNLRSSTLGSYTLTRFSLTDNNIPCTMIYLTAGSLEVFRTWKGIVLRIRIRVHCEREPKGKNTCPYHLLLII